MWLVLYICFFILAKYVDSLVQNEVAENAIDIVIGLSAVGYDTTSDRVFFRYNPPEPSWILLIFVGM
jgi:hypothetical protein